MHAYLVTGGTKLLRQKEIGRRQKELGGSVFDQVILRLEGPSIGIAQVRDFQKSLLLAPVNSPLNFGIITDADRLTVEAQQALLKTLEEPPPHAKIILETPIINSLLPTIISRCQIISLANSDQYSKEELSQCFKILEKLMDSPVGERLKIIEGIIKTREDAKSWTELAIATLHEALLTGRVTISYSQLLRNFLQAQRQLAVNVNPKLAIDNIFLNSRPNSFPNA